MVLLFSNKLRVLKHISIGFEATIKGRKDIACFYDNEKLPRTSSAAYFPLLNNIGNSSNIILAGYDLWIDFVLS